MNETTSVAPEEREARPPGEGDVVCGKYRLLRLLGEGGMGVIYEAEHLRLRQSVAIKFLRPEVLALPDAIERFEREARASARIRGPHVVQVLDVDSDDQGRPHMVMELLRGRDLEAELRARGPLPVAAAVDLVLQACVAVGQAHAAGVVHRDLKPSNLFLTEEAGKRVLKVLDFGISKISRDADATAAVTSHCMTVGTPLYMSPEQMRNSRDVDGRSDIWSLGVILYELIAGAPPFLGTTTAAIAAIVADAMPSLRRVRSDVPEGLERVLVTALAKVPDDRLPTAEALGAALLPFASPDGVAGPFSLRPSQRDFALASDAMARTPPSPRVRDSAELFALPVARTPRVWRTTPNEATLAARTIRTARPREALRTFAGTLVIGMVLASAATVVLSRPQAAIAARAGHVIGLASPAPAPRDGQVRLAPLAPASPAPASTASAAPVAAPEPPARRDRDRGEDVTRLAELVTRAAASDLDPMPKRPPMAATAMPVSAPARLPTPKVAPPASAGPSPGDGDGPSPYL